MAITKASDSVLGYQMDEKCHHRSCWMWLGKVDVLCDVQAHLRQLDLELWVFVSLALREGRENLFILMMTQTVVCWESTSTVSISLCAGAASWPRPRPWPPDTVSIDYCDSTRGAKTPLEADVGTTGATSAEANSRLQLLHGACFLSHEVSTNKRADSQSVLCLTGRKQERFALKWLMLSSLVVSMMVISPVRL